MTAIAPAHVAVAHIAAAPQAGPGLGLLWAALVAGLLARRRPAPGRVRALVTARRPPRPRPAGRGNRRWQKPSWAALAEAVGARLFRLAPGRSPPPDRAAARRLGAAVLVALPLLVVAPPAAPAAVAVAWALPGVRRRRAERRRQAAMADALPEVVDLLVVAVEAGMTVPLALASVVKRARGPLRDQLAVVGEQVRVGGRRLADALDDLPAPARAGEGVRPLVAALTASERYGAPLTASLARLADEVRRQRRRRAEEAARRVPVKLLFPLIFCVLPAFALLTVAPLVAGALRSLRL
jgi:tight adherence protein C